jgi:hypothetical protein
MRTASGTLRKKEDQREHQQQKDGGRTEPAEREAAFVDGLVEEVADDRAQRAREHEG